MMPTMKTALVLLATTLVGKTLAGNGGDTPSICVDIVMPITATASNLVIPLTTPLTYQKVSGTWNIAARYCEPQASIQSRLNTLQVLVHGITYTHGYWSANEQPGVFENQNSWIDFASKQGFPTLAIDRLGNGLSDHPDATNVLQTPLQVEIKHKIIDMARDGNLPIQSSRKFQKIIYVGHSYGSFIGNSLTAKYPNDTDAIILTGLTTTFNWPFVIPLESSLVPAKSVNPAKWGQLPPDYLAINNKTAMEEAFYYPNYFNQGLIDHDWDVRGTVGVGEVVTITGVSTAVAPDYKNPVLDITGQHDSLFCTNLDPLTAVSPWQTYNCGNQHGTVAKTKSLYPNASFQPYAPDNTGHCINFQYSAPAVFGYAHNWLSLNQF